MALAAATGGVMLVGLSLTLRQTALDIAGIEAITLGLMAMGAALALSGVISGIANWRVSRSDIAAVDVGSGPRRALMIAAAALPVVLPVLLLPLIAYWRDLGRLADQYDVLATANGPSAMVFVPAAGVLLVPGVEAVAALTIAMHCFSVLLLLLTRSAAVRKTSALGAVLVGGLCAASWAGAIVTKQLTPAVETLIRTTAGGDGQEQARMLDLVERHRMVCLTGAQGLLWGWAALVFIAVGTRVAVRPRAEPVEPLGEQPLPLHAMVGRARQQALLDAADRLHETTLPRRF